MAWDSDISYALGLYRKIGKILGTWPLDSKYIFSNIRLAFVAIVIMCMCINFTNQLLQKGACGTITEIVDIISLLSCGCVVLIKLTVLMIHQNKICIIVNSAIKDWSDIIHHESRSVMLRYAIIGRRIFISQAVGYFISILSTISTRLPPLEYFLNNGSNSSVLIIGVPLWPDCWTPTTISMDHYTVLFIFQSITLIVFDACYFNCDSFFFGMIMHLCGQFHVLSTNFKYFHDSSTKEYHIHQLVKLVRRHRHLLTMANGFEDIYNLIILIHVGAATMIICVSGIVLLVCLQSSDFVIVVEMACRIIITYFQLFMYCYAGEQLRTEAMNIKNVIYNSPWFNMPLSTVRDMVFVIMRSDYPVSLTAGKIYVMNFPNFITIIKTISSYFSVIRLAFKDNK